MTLLQVRNLYAGYGEMEVIHGVSFEVGEGEAVALLGANGAGKTTLLRALSRLIPSRGEITFNKQPLQRLSPHEVAAMGIAHVPEGRGILASLTVEENLELGGLSTRQPGWRRRFQMVYELFPILWEKRRQPAGTLSGGQQQMLALGRAMMANPKLYLLDEPSHGLAPVVVKELTRALQELRRTGASIILAEQNVTVALEVAERGLLLENGRISYFGTRDQLRANQMVQKAYLGVV